MILPIQSKFQLGQVVITRNALDTLKANDVQTALQRHASGDWGDLEAEDRQANEMALRSGGRLLSAYQDGNGVRFWIITEHDRSVTTALLPEDY
jgi:hypothetical protein